MLLSLDINSNRTGYAFGGVSDGAPRASVWRLPGCKDPEALTRSCAGLYLSISELCKLIHPVVIVLEAPFNPQGARKDSRSNASTIMASMSLSGVARAAARNAGAKVVLAHVQTWRKHFCGHGRPENPKQATMERCRLLGWAVKNDDEGDACGLWSWGMATNFPKWAPKSTPLFAKGRAA